MVNDNKITLKHLMVVRWDDTKFKIMFLLNNNFDKV